MELSEGIILDGTVRSITKFGAFIALPENRVGLVHISEIAQSYVSDVREHLKEGQTVRVMVLNRDGNKINLSIKRALPAGTQQKRPASGPRSGKPAQSAGGEPQSFDDMLKRFMADSDSKISGLKQYSEHRTRTRRR